MENLPLFKERLLLARRRSDLTQDDLARLVRMHKSDVSKMERGKMLPSVPRLQRLAAALGVSSDFLLGTTPGIHDSSGRVDTPACLTSETA